MTITNLPSYPQSYITSQYPLASPASHHVHPAHPHAHHQPHHAAYTHHPHPQHPQHTQHPQHPQHTQHPQTHVLTGPIRSDPVTRKRPKYTRSKTGCLTCRVKKIKCDETKPTCTRCAHGQRDCNWPENVPPRKKLATKKQSDQPDEERTSALTPESASPSSSAPTTAREASPARKSPLGSLSPPEGAVASRRTRSEPNTAVGSPMASPIDPPKSSTGIRRPSLPQNVHSPPAIPYPRQPYPTLTPPSVSPASFHPSPPSSHDYSSYSGSPVSTGHNGHNGHNGHSAAIPRHELPSIHTSHPRLADLAVDAAHGLSHWHTAPIITSTVDPIEPFFRTIQERNLVGRSPASYAS